jgi:hypothetical protein
MLLSIFLAAVVSQPPMQAADGSVNKVIVRVIDDRCDPVPGAFVTLRPQPSPSRPPNSVKPVSCVSGASGVANCGPVMHGSWEIVASLPGFYEARMGPAYIDMYGGLSVTLCLTQDWSDHGFTLADETVVVPRPSPAPPPYRPVRTDRSA